MVRKGDAEFKSLLDGVIVGMMKSGEFEAPLRSLVHEGRAAQQSDFGRTHERSIEGKPEKSERPALQVRSGGASGGCVLTGESGS